MRSGSSCISRSASWASRSTRPSSFLPGETQVLPVGTSAMAKRRSTPNGHAHQANGASLYEPTSEREPHPAVMDIVVPGVEPDGAMPSDAAGATELAAGDGEV